MIGNCITAKRILVETSDTVLFVAEMKIPDATKST